MTQDSDSPIINRILGTALKATMTAESIPSTRSRHADAGNGRARAQRLSPEDRRDQLLVCAVKVFSERGLAVGNHALVAAEAQVSVPTVFVYFKTHEALVGAVLDEVEQVYLAKVVHAEAAAMTALEAILDLSRGLTQTLDSHPAHARLFREWSVCTHSEHWPRYLRLYRKLTRALAKAIERGQHEGSIRPEVNPDDEAAIFYAGATATMQMIETGASAERLDKFERSIILPVLTLNALSVGAAAPLKSAEGKRTERAGNGRSR